MCVDVSSRFLLLPLLTLKVVVDCTELGRFGGVGGAGGDDLELGSLDFKAFGIRDRTTMLILPTCKGVESDFQEK